MQSIPFHPLPAADDIPNKPAGLPGHVLLDSIFLGQQLETMLSPLSSNTGMDLDANMDAGPVTVSQDARAGAANARPGRVPAPTQRGNGIRLRTSCDACQNLKVRCSQDKPSCRRCSKNGLDCVYSPLRRMGRPKKPPVVPSTAPSAISSSPPIHAATPQSHSHSRSQSQSHDSQRQRHATTTPIPASPFQPQPMGHAPGDIGNLFGTMPPFGLENGDLDPEGLYSGGTGLGAESDTLTGHSSAAILEDRPSTTSIVNDGLFSLSAGLDGPPALTRQHPRLPPSPLAALVGFDSQGIGTHQRHSSSNGEQISEEAGHCYLAIIQRLSRLEATIDTGQQPPRLDVILSAERDTRALKERILSCQGHERSPQSCTDAHGSSLLVLGLLADRVTSLFEDLFRRAAVSSHSMDQATRGTTASWLYGPLPAFASQAGERQYERSVRSSFSRNIQCPVPEANCELTIGNFEVDIEVKSRVMKLILKQRVGALERMLEELRDHLKDVAGQGDRPGRGRNGQRPAGELESILLGSVKSSRSLSRAATAYMVEDLHRRAEMLRGRLELAGH